MFINKNYLIYILIFLLFIYFITLKENFNDSINFNHFIVYHYDNKIRLGNEHDGGYVIGLLENNNYDFYISAGIENEESFSRDFINKFNLNENNSKGFDGTIEKYPTEYTDKITFVKKNIGTINNDNETNLHDILDNYKDIFIKMDIEGYEFPWLLTLNKTQLNNIKQITLEVHGVCDDSWGTTLNEKINCFNKLNETHYLIHAHGNNNSNVKDNIPEVLELTYIRKNELSYIPEFNKSKLPNILDYPNKHHENDHDLNFYPFVHS